MKIPAWPKIFHLGDKPVQDIFDGPVEVTEKIDGSQFSFGTVRGELLMRSKGAPVYLNDGNKMFNRAAEFATALFNNGLLTEGCFYHGEYLQGKRHNTLEYDRVPTGNFALYGVTLSDGSKLADHDCLMDIAKRLGCDVVPLIYEGVIRPAEALDFIKSVVDRRSYLGGCNAEGLVVKNYTKDMLVGGQHIPIMQAKYVTEQFKEKHKVSWPSQNKSAIERIADAYAAEPRWHKAIQRAKEAGTLEGSPRDIGPLLKSINEDILAEEQDNIKEMLFKMFWKDISRLAVRGFPEWYKQKLVDDNFNQAAE